MTRISRDPVSAARETYDLIIIGGGIYGAMLSLEASQRGLRPLLLERGDFGEHTSLNSLRIIHGGLRYLQSLDLHRFRESVAERRWFLRTFPNLVKPLPCLMPLYGGGLRRPFVLRMALWANALLSHNRNQGVREGHHLPSGHTIDVDQTQEIFSLVNRKGLKGGAVWYDAIMPDSQRLLINVLRWACELGATALNYVEARQLLKHKENVVGVMAIDRESGESHEYRANEVVNSCGPWCRDIAASFDRDKPTLFKGSLMWNVLLDREAISDHAVAVTPKKAGGQTYFLVPWKGKLFAGTGHVPWVKGTSVRPMPSTDQLDEFLRDLNLAVPRLGLSMNDIIRVFSGLLPVTEEYGTKLVVREVILDHSDHDGPHGLFSISGVKFTTSRLVAEKTLNCIFPENKKPKSTLPPMSAISQQGIFDFQWCPIDEDTVWKEDLRRLIAEESVLHLDDLILRRTSLGDNPPRAIKVTPFICDLFDWDETRRLQEIKRMNYPAHAAACFEQQIKRQVSGN